MTFKASGNFVRRNVLSKYTDLGRAICTKAVLLEPPNCPTLKSHSISNPTCITPGSSGMFASIISHALRIAASLEQVRTETSGGSTILASSGWSSIFTDVTPFPRDGRHCMNVAASLATLSVNPRIG